MIQMTEKMTEVVMKVPENKTIHHGKKKYKPGSELPDNLLHLLEPKKKQSGFHEKQERTEQKK